MTVQVTEPANWQEMLISRLEGEGVGSAIDHGHRRLLEVMDSEFISVVMAGDGQMDPDDMESLITPIVIISSPFQRRGWIEQGKCRFTGELEPSSCQY